MRKLSIFIFLALFHFVVFSHMFAEKKSVEVIPEIQYELGKTDVNIGPIETDAEGNFYIFDINNVTLVKVLSGSSKIEKWNLKSALGKSNTPEIDDFFVGKDGLIYFINIVRKKVIVCDASLKIIFIIKSVRVIHSFSVDSKGNIFISGEKSGEHDAAIYRYSRDGKFIRKFGTDVTGTSHSILNSALLFHDEEDNLYQFFRHYWIRRKYSPEGKLLLEKTRIAKKSGRERMIIKDIFGENLYREELVGYDVIRDGEFPNGAFYFTSGISRQTFYSMKKDLGWSNIWYFQPGSSIYSLHDIAIDKKNGKILFTKVLTAVGPDAPVDIYSVSIK